MITLLFTLWIGPILSPYFGRLSDQLLHWNSWHTHCLQSIPYGEFRTWHQAIVCGATPPPEDIVNFQTIGLYHLLVVSGAHLSFLSLMLEGLDRFQFGKALRFSIITLYLPVCQFQPPLVRSWFELLISSYSSKLKLPQNHLLLCLFSGTWTLLVFPQWISSFSFWLSWLATLACRAIQQSPQNTLTKTALIQLLILPGVFSISGFHPLQILANWILGPVLGYLLFPLCLLTTLIHQLQFISDFLWSLLDQILIWICPYMEMGSGSPSIYFLLIYVTSLQTIFWITDCRRLRP